MSSSVMNADSDIAHVGEIVHLVVSRKLVPLAGAVALPQTQY